MGRIMKAVVLAVIIIPILFPVSNVFAEPATEISVPVIQILNWKVEYLYGDDEPVLLIILKREPGKPITFSYDAVYENGIAPPLPEEIETESEFRFGNEFLICQYQEAPPDFSDPAATVKLKPLFSMDFTAARPMSVTVGDIDGDGNKEISLCMFKTTKFHPVYAKRPFLYRYEPEEKRLVPVWLGSRLSRPFDTYGFADLDGNGTDELISVETNRDGKKVITCYYWWDFGFYKLGESRPFDNILSLEAYSPDITEGRADFKAVVEVKEQAVLVEFIYIENENPGPGDDYGRIVMKEK